MNPEWVTAFIEAHPAARPEDGLIGWDDDADAAEWEASFIPGWCDDE